MTKLLLLIGLSVTASVFSQINSAKVYWVGHSLISHTDIYTPSSTNLIDNLGTLASSQSKTYSFHQHTTPGSPLGWNWGASPVAWASSQVLIAPLIDASDPEYGTFDVMVLTEAVELNGYYDWWSSGFYARKFYNAAINANPATRLFMYESWQHFQASDDASRPYYGPMSTFDFRQYMIDMRVIWESIIDEASDPALTPVDAGYVYQGSAMSATDPGFGGSILPINIIPTGQVLLDVFERLALNLPSDNWDYNGAPLTELDFFSNPFSNFPTDTITTVQSAPVDDIHPSNVMVYLNALVHYSVIYQDNPSALPAINGVPSNVADIFKEVVWNNVTNDYRTGVSAAGVNDNKTIDFVLYPNPATSQLTINGLATGLEYKVFNSLGQELLKGAANSINISNLSKGVYTLRIGSTVKRFIKK